MEWIEDGSRFGQTDFRSLESAMQFCPCSMDAATGQRIVVPGVVDVKAMLAERDRAAKERRA